MERTGCDPYEMSIYDIGTICDALPRLIATIEAVEEHYKYESPFLSHKNCQICSVAIANRESGLVSDTKHKTKFGFPVQNGINEKAYNGECDRTHEECADCELEKATPQLCNGHFAGPTACKMFVPRKPIAVVVKFTGEK